MKKLIQRIKNLFHICEYPECWNKGEKYELEHETGNKFFYYCGKHAQAGGFCWYCGEYWAGVEGFDFGNGLCENCRCSDCGEPTDLCGCDDDYNDLETISDLFDDEELDYTVGVGQ